MARTYYVKAAQPRYKMVPVLNEDGTPKTTPVIGRNGEQKKNKHGRPTTRRVTTADKNQPLPNHKCGKCGTEIKPGDPYKWIAPKSGPYGGRKLYRCGKCPGWQVWEYSQSLSARLAEIQHNAEQDAPTEADVDAMQAHLESVAEAIRELAEEKRESAQSIEDGFGHETYQSQELTDTADQLDSWADEVESTDLPEVPEPCTEHDEDWEPDTDCTCPDRDGDPACDHCNQQEAKDNCEDCAAHDEFDEDQWLTDALDAINNCPV